MTDRDILQALYENMRAIYDDVHGLKEDVHGLKEDVYGLKEDVHTLKDDVHALQDDMQVVKQKVTNLELTLENETNHNIQLLAENHINLVDKLNQAIRVQDKSLLFEVQVSGLRMRVEHLEKDVAEVKALLCANA